MKKRTARERAENQRARTLRYYNSVRRACTRYYNNNIIIIILYREECRERVRVCECRARSPRRSARVQCGGQTADE